ncbi:unnamed protein product [Rhizoctonia solani]|uniref:NACHT domain-containing protein n=1 Tax=Rhizoctonia solani TaxID=456999 RepID=A0A8H2XWF6_9AGAM|nr:unnamed protein product [Rhizoctonia solani]
MSFRDRFRTLKRNVKSRINSIIHPHAPQLSVTSAQITGHVNPGTLALDIGSSNPSGQHMPGSEPASTIDHTLNNHTFQWNNLRSLLRALESVSGAIPPLKALFDLFVECVGVYDNIGNGREEYIRLKNELEDLFEELQRCFVQAPPPAITISMERLCRVMHQELKKVQDSQASISFRYREAIDKSEEVLASYQRIYRHLQRLTLNVNLSVWKAVDNLAADNRVNLLPASLLTRYNSTKAVELKRGECAPDTRTDVLAQLRSWAYSHEAKNLFWLNGMAGTGKTTITYSLCTELDSDRKLAASFFCSRLIPECRDVNLIIPSIAYQLARASKPFHYALSRALEADPDAHAKLFRIQFDTLIASPLAEVGAALPENMVVVIDALDECTDKESTGQILDILLTRASHLPLKFLVSSRPEPKIRDKLEETEAWICPSLTLHNLDRQITQADIRTYLRMSLAPMDLPQSQITMLAERAGILFIYAATVVRFIGYDNFRQNPRARLEIILGASASSQGFHLRELDQLYSTILKEALNNPSLTTTEQRDIREVLQTVICARESLTLSGLCGLLKFEDLERVRTALRPLWSVLHIVNANEVVTTLHMSFSDYLLDPSRSGEYSCDAVSQNRNIALLCFQCIKDTRPQFNICGLESSFLVDQKVAGLEERVRNAISPELFYACQHWAAHLQATDSSRNLVEELEDFFSKRLLLWIEVMNLKGAVHSSGKLLKLAEDWSTCAKCPQELIELIRDSWRFASAFALNNISASTPHLYVSMLSLWPPDNPISKCYSSRMRRSIKAHDEATSRSQFALIAKWKVEENAHSVSFSSDGSRIAVGAGKRVYVMNAFDGTILLALSKGNNSQINSAIFSSDGKLVAACCTDRHIYVWEVQTGEVIFNTYEGTPGFTTSISFSPENSNIISGSKDGVVRIWDPLVGQMLLELPGGPSVPVMTVAISSDGSLIAAGYRVMNVCVWNARTSQLVANLLAGPRMITSISFSFDCTRIVSGTFEGLIYAWDVQTRRMVLGPLKGHTHHITSVAFSPDDKRIVSSAADRSIRFWDSESGSSLMLLGGHTNPVASIAFSPDGTQVASTISSRAISIWDGRSQYTHSRPSAGHADFVIFVGFSPDGNIVSGSCDGAVMTWDPRTGTQISRLDGDDVWSLALSPDGHVIASGSYDRSIHLRDASDGQLLLDPLKGHSGYVISIQFSPDGTRIVSGSTDMTLCIWSTQNGRMLLGPLKGHTHLVSSVEFSPDGNHIVSGSSDGKVIAWSSHNGQMILGPLLGHTGKVNSVKFSPDGTRIASGSDDRTICVWDTQTGQLVYGPIEGHTASVRSVAFSYDGALIASGSLDRNICVWNAQSGQLALDPLKGHTNWVSCVVFSPDGTRIISGSDDKTVRVHDIGVLNPVVPGADLKWEVKEDGWITEEQSRLLAWVPPYLRKAIMWPRTTLLLSTDGFLYLDFNHAFIGDSWDRCYTSA